MFDLWSIAVGILVALAVCKWLDGRPKGQYIDLNRKWATSCVDEGGTRHPMPRLEYWTWYTEHENARGKWGDVVRHAPTTAAERGRDRDRLRALGLNPWRQVKPPIPFRRRA